MTPTQSRRKGQPLPPRTTLHPSDGGRPFMSLLMLLFVGSGCAALIYEVVWFQLLTLNIGSSAISLGIVLGTFMLGMCIGSILMPKYIRRSEHPLRVYALLEAGIGVMGLIVLFAVPIAGGIYTHIGGPGVGGLLLRGLVCAICLLPPTLLMGATLPAIARWVEATPRGVSWLGFFYGGNIAGGVVGCIFAGYYLLRVHDMFTATVVAVLINFAVAGIGFALAKRSAYEPSGLTDASITTGDSRGWWPVYLAIGISGMTALGAEVVWTRLLSLILGATVYTFSLILAAVLAGLGIGSSLGSIFARSGRNPRIAFGVCQLLLMGCIAWAGYSLNEALPYWPINPALSTSPWLTFQIDLVRCLWTVLPAAILWGASFPLALAGVAVAGEDTGRMVGRIYAANTVGAILGAMLTSLVFVAHFGTQNTQRILVALAALAAALMLIPVFTAGGRITLRRQSAVWAAVIAALAFYFGSGIIEPPPLLVAYGRYMATWIGYAGDIIYVGEGLNSSIAISKLPNGVVNYHNAGKVQASSEPQDMRLQRMLGHLATLLPENPKKVLVIACGAGVTAGSVSVDPLVEREVIVEIEPLVPKAASRFFGDYNFNVVTNPKVDVQIDDARHWLLTTDEKFDAITSDPFDPWVKGAATLYTKEFFELIKDHLNPGGVVTVFVQLYQSGMPAVKSEVASFIDAFPDALIFGNTHEGGGYDIVLVGMKDPKPIDIDRIQKRLLDPANAAIANSLSEIGFNSAVDLFGRYAGTGPALEPWLVDAEINTDRNLRLQYLAGFGLNAFEQKTIYDQILSYRTLPPNIFSGAPESLLALQYAIEGAR
jgi:spermidine synthase